MTRCIKCGAENPDESEFCNKCGSQLSTTGQSKPYKRMEDECFDFPKGSAIFALFIGIMIVFAGLGFFLPKEMDGINLEKLWWAILVFGVGILIIAGVIYGYQRKR
jgi:uncharacterized membrane protein YvbJ